MSSSGNIKFAVVGLGHIGKRHAEMIKRNEGAELVAVCDIDPNAIYDGAPLYHTLDEMLEKHPDVNVVSICTPNGLHTEQSMLVLSKGHHVVCEKPMGLTKASCEAVIHKALSVNRQVFVVMQNRYSPPSEWLKKIVSENIIGDIYMVQINCYWNRDDRYYQPSTWKGLRQLDGGTLFTQFSHFIDIMYWIFGDIKNIQTRFANFNHEGMIEFEDSGMVSFEFLSGGMGVLNYSTSVWDKNMESSLTVIGSKGSIKIGGQYMDKVEYCHIENYHMPQLSATNPANDYGGYKGSANNHHLIIQNVVDTLSGKSAPSTNALEGLKVVEIIERIYKSNPYYV